MIRRKTVKERVKDFFISRLNGEYTGPQIAATLEMAEELDQVETVLLELFREGYLQRRDNAGLRGAYGYKLTPRIVTIDVNEFTQKLAQRIAEDDEDKWTLTQLFEPVGGSGDPAEDDIADLDSSVQLSNDGIDYIVDAAVGILEDDYFDQTQGRLVMSGVEFINRERTKQIHDRGFTPEADDQYTKFQLSTMACSYVLSWISFNSMAQTLDDQLARLGLDRWKHVTNPVDDLSKAGALVAAEIDRLMRQKAVIPEEKRAKIDLSEEITQEIPVTPEEDEEMGKIPSTTV